MKLLKPVVLFILTALTLGACGSDSTTTTANDASSDEVKARQSLMQDWRGANDILKGMMENPANFDAAVFKEQAEFINSSTAKMWPLFHNENAKGKSQDTIWTDAAGYKTKQDEFSTAAQELVAASANAKSADDVHAAFGKMAEGCGSCHKVYKK